MSLCSSTARFGKQHSREVRHARGVPSRARPAPAQRGEGTRTTKDIDLAGADDEQSATASLIAAQAINLRDHLSFNVLRTPKLDRAETFRAVRYSVTAEIAGRRFERFPVDVALGEQPTSPPERLPVPSLLSFAEIETTEIPVIAIEQHIAEKLHAYTASYGPQQHQSTRVKDLIDLVHRRSRHALREPLAGEPPFDVPYTRATAAPNSVP